MNRAVFERAQAHLKSRGWIAPDEPVRAVANAAILRPGTAGAVLTDRRLVLYRRSGIDREVLLEQITAYGVRFRPGRLLLSVAVEGEGVQSLEVPGNRRQTEEFLRILDQQFGARRPRIEANRRIDLEAYRGRPLAALLAHSLRRSLEPEARIVGLLRDEGQGRELLTALHYRVSGQDRLATIRFSREWDHPALKAWLYFLNLTRAAEDLRAAHVELLSPTAPPPIFLSLCEPSPRSSFLPRAAYARRPGDPVTAAESMRQLIRESEPGAATDSARECASWIERHLTTGDHNTVELRAPAELLAAAIGTELVASKGAHWLPEKGRHQKLSLNGSVIELELAIRGRLESGEPLGHYLEGLGL